MDARRDEGNASTGPMTVPRALATGGDRWTTLRRALADGSRDLAAHEVFILAGSIAYAGLLSLFPLLVGLIVLLSMFLDPPVAQQVVVDGLRPYLPATSVDVVRSTLEAIFRTREAAGAVAVVGLFWGATAVASTLRHALNRVLAAPSRSFWKRKLVELALVTLAGAFVSLSLIVSALGRAAAAVPALLEVTEVVRRSLLLTPAAAAGSVALSAAAIAVVYWFLPHRRLRGRSLLGGTLTALVLFEASKHAFFLYVGTLANYPLVYGPLAGMVVFMVWVYLVALVILIGAEVIAVLERLAGSQGGSDG